MNTHRSIAALFQLDRGAAASLQTQLRTKIVHAIHQGVLRPGLKLPSSRALSRDLGVARNTVSLAYQELIASGHLEPRQRSGVYVASDSMPRPVIADGGVGEPARSRESSAVMRHASDLVIAQTRFRPPPQWREMPYPFVEGLYDRTLFPTTDWREASRLALAVDQVASWSTDRGETDDELLIEQLRQKILPRRGITAAADEVLVTVGEQQALYLVFRLLSTERSVVAFEDPSEPEIRALAQLGDAQCRYLAVDDEGVQLDQDLSDVDLFYVSPCRQRPTGVSLSARRRAGLRKAMAQHDFLLLEDDFESDLSFLGGAEPALKADDPDGRIVYTASLSKVLAPGLRLGFLVGPPDFIRAARRLRDLMTRKPSPITQRTAGIFLSLGHYDAMLRRLDKVYENRMIALRDALNHYRPLSIVIPPVTGGTSYWVKGPDGLDSARLMREAMADGVLIEPVASYFADPQAHPNIFRLGVTSIAEPAIREGIQTLGRVMTRLAEAGDRFPDQNAGVDQPASAALDGDAIRRKLAGQRLSYQTVYGEPCTIDLHQDGSMTGRAGYAQEDRDQGRWWVDDGQWCRQWANWAYGEVGVFYVECERNQLFWLDETGRRVDRAIIVGPIPANENLAP